VLLDQVVETIGLLVVVEVEVGIILQHLLEELAVDLVDLMWVLVMEHKEELHQQRQQVKILVLVVAEVTLLFLAQVQVVS
jgi:hypothetical protein